MKWKSLISAVLVLSGCAFDDSLVHDPELRLMFQPEMYMHVSQEGTVRFPTEENFAVCAWKSDGTVYLPLSEASSREVVITDNETGLEAKDTLWLISEELMWPSLDEKLTFLAYSPAGMECGCDLQDGISFRTDILQDQTDILYTEPHANRHKVDDGWVVPLQFSHALCQVNFRIKNRVTDKEEIAIRRISIEQARHSGSFASLKSPQWVTDEELEEIVFYEGACPTENLPKAVGKGVLMIPQKLDTKIRVQYDYTTEAGSTISMDLTTSTIKTLLEAGNSYTYTLSVGIDDVKLMQEIIGDTFE